MKVCSYCPKKATKVCNCSDELICDDHMPTHFIQHKGPSHLMTMILRKILGINEKQAFTTEIYRSLEKIRLTRSGILITTQVLTNIIRSCSVRLIEKLESKGGYFIIYY